MPKSNHSGNPSSELNTDTHSSKKWFSKITLKIPKKLKNGKNNSSLSNALQNAKKNNNNHHNNNNYSNNLEVVSLPKCNLDNSISAQTIYESSNENTAISNNSSFLIKDGSSVQSSQLTINTSKNESTVSSFNSNNSTPVIFVSSEYQNNPCIDTFLKDTQNQTKNHNENLSINTNHSETGLKSNAGHHRARSEFINTPTQRPRSYSDTPVPLNRSMLYSDDEYIADSKSFEAPENSKLDKVALGIMKDNYYIEKDIDLYDIKTPVVASHNIPINDSNHTTPSNTIIGKPSVKNTSDTNTPVLKHREAKINTTSATMPSVSDRKFMDLVESIQHKSCDNMTAKEFALAVGLNVRCEDDDSSDDSSDEDDRNSICTLSSTLSQLTANGKVPTANEIYNALSVKSLNRQRKKHSIPALNPGMFVPPTAEEMASKRISPIISSNSSPSLTGDCCSNPCQRTFGDLSHKSSNQKLEKRLSPPPCICTNTNRSNESCSTYIGSTPKYSSSSSIYSSQSGNTTAYISDLPENDFDSYSSCSSYQHQLSMNGCSPDANGKNNISVSFYSLPRVTFHPPINNCTLSASKSTNSISSSNFYLPNYNTYRDMGMGCNGRRHSRVSSTISSNSQSSSVKKAPSSPIQFNPSPVPTLSNSPIANKNVSNKMSVSDSRNMYINSKTIATSNASSMTNCHCSSNYPTPSSWSNGLSDIENLRLANKPPTTKPIECISTNKNNVQVYTKGRFTITHETYPTHTASTHKFQIEKN